MPDEEMPPEQIDHLAALALRPEIGEKFTIAGREFTRSFLRLDADEDLIALLADLAKNAAGADLQTLFLAALPALRNAAIIILADVAGEERHAMADWIATTRGVNNRALLDLVIAQIQLQEAGVLLGKLFMASGLFHALSGTAPAPLPTSAAPA